MESKLNTQPKESTSLGRSFGSRRNRQVIKKSGLMRVNSEYLRNNRYHLFLQGRTPITKMLEQTTLIIPTIDCFQSSLSTILKEFPLRQENSSIILLILQSILKLTLEKSSQVFQKACKLLLFESPSSDRLVFMNEIIEEISCVDEQNQIDSYKLTLNKFIRACSYLEKYMNVKVHVLTLYENDRSIEALKLNQIKHSTIEEYIQTSHISEHHKSSILIEYQNMMSNIIKITNNNLQVIEKNIFKPFLSMSDISIGLKNGSLYRGTLNIYPHSNNQSAEVELIDYVMLSNYGNKVLINGKTAINRAFDGDEVIVRLLPIDQWANSSTEVPTVLESNEVTDDIISEELVLSTQITNDHQIPTAEVVRIIKRVDHEIIALVPTNRIAATFGKEEFILVLPQNRNFPKIRIRTRQLEKLQGCRVCVVIDDWLSSSEFPNGHIIKILSNDFLNFQDNINILLLYHSITQRPFSLQALACLPVTDIPITIPISSERKREIWTDSNWKIPENEYKNRIDLRTARKVFSVDPPGCQDIDDSMHVCWLEDGLIEVGVSIADVNAFITQGNALDLEAQVTNSLIVIKLFHRN